MLVFLAPTVQYYLTIQINMYLSTVGVWRHYGCNSANLLQYVWLRICMSTSPSLRMDWEVSHRPQPGNSSRGQWQGMNTLQPTLTWFANCQTIQGRNPQWFSLPSQTVQNTASHLPLPCWLTIHPQIFSLFLWPSGERKGERKEMGDQP